MRIVCDCEADGLTPTKLHIVVCQDIDTGDIFRFYDGQDELFRSFLAPVTLIAGHNFLAFDRPALNRLWKANIPFEKVVDTLVLSRLTDSTREKHSLESWGEELGEKKLHTDITDWSVLTPEMEERCVGDVKTNLLLFKKFERFLDSEKWKDAIETEHFIAEFCNILNSNGFTFALEEAKELKEIIDKELHGIDEELVTAFLPKVELVREVTPRLTKKGTIARNSIPKVLGNDLTSFTPDAPFSLIEYVPFNPASPRQIVARLNEAGWQPTEKTKGHKDTEKAIRELKRKRRKGPPEYAQIATLEARLAEYGVSGWMICEENLKTLPDTAPKAAQTLAKRLLLASRSSTLNTWIEACKDDGRIHGSFNHIGAWTHRMSHDRPNMGNIPKFDSKQPHKTPYSDRMRSLWRASPGRYLVGVDAESIQLRIFGHYINDEQFIKSLISGKKEDGTDPHSLNQKALGVVCRSRDDAKTFIYAWLLGAGIAKVAAILGCSKSEAQQANDNFLDFYPGLKLLREEIIPEDAANGYFRGFDGRFVRIWGDDYNSRCHFTLAGYLQTGEAIIMKRAAQLWYPRLVREGVPFWPVNFVHDEWQTETVRDLEVAKYVAEVQAGAIKQVGEDLGLNCPMAGSVLSAHGNLAIGDNWMETH